MRHALAAVLLAGVACACSASNPVAPVDETPVALLLTSFTSISVPSVSVGSFIYYKAYAVTRDRAYIDVTSQVQWTTTDVGILRPGTNDGAGYFFTGVIPGNVDVVARLQDLQASLPASVVPANRTIFPSISVTSPGTMMLGDTFRLSGIYRESQSALIQTVTNGVAWASSNPAVVVIEDGVARGVGVGTSFFTVTYNGVSATFYFSIHPRR